jgi:hypothetical protein
VLGVGGDRLDIYNVNSCEPDRFVALATAFAKKIKACIAEPKQVSMDK